MARTVPALPAVLPEPTELGTGQPITGGSTSPLRQTTQALNLAHATLGTGVLWQQVWADGQWVTTGGNEAFQIYSIRVPVVSSAHTEAVLTLVASGGGTSGDFVRLTCFENATVEDSAAIGSAGRYTITIDLTGGATTSPITGGRDFYDLSLGVGGDVTIESLHLAILPGPAIASGSWPGADGELDGAAVDGFEPIDDNETESDEWLTADLGLGILGNLNALRDRVRVHHAWSGVSPVGGSTDALYPQMPPLFQRVEGHCLSGGEPLRQAGGEPAHLWEVWISVSAATIDQELTVEGGQVQYARLEAPSGGPSFSGWHHLWLDPRALLPDADLGELWASLRIRARGATTIDSRARHRVDDSQDDTDNINAIVVWGP